MNKPPIGPKTLMGWQKYIQLRIELQPNSRLYEELGRTVMLIIKENEMAERNVARINDSVERLHRWTVDELVNAVGHLELQRHNINNQMEALYDELSTRPDWLQRIEEV